jgi:hypothetical protein
MPRHPFTPPRGLLETFEVTSERLTNTLGDPISRQVGVYRSSLCESDDDQYPLFVDLAAFTNSALGHLGWKAFSETLLQRIDRLEDEGQLGPAIWVFPDSFTSLGGNQFVDSPVTGQWATWLHTDLLEALEARYPVRKDPGGRALFGKSSGGFGALHQVLNHGEHWAAAACHSGDMGFELGYAADLSHALLYLEQQGVTHIGALDRIQAKKRLGGGDFQYLMIAALCASYDPAPDQPWGVQLPLDSFTGERIEARWLNWLAFDPLTQVQDDQKARRLAGLSGLFIDCGRRDQYHLVYGARRFKAACEARGLGLRFEEFDDTHSGIDYRLDVSLPYLYAQLTEAAISP